jgi:surface antigen
VAIDGSVIAGRTVEVRAQEIGAACGCAEVAPMVRRRLGLVVLLVLLGSASVGTASSLADVAPQQWQPTFGDASRAVRPCAAAMSAPVCWSMTEDTSAWMAQPAGSPYGWGQCTYYVGLMRPDIWNDRAPPSLDPVTGWDAWTWAGHAQAEGLAVDGTPRPGDVMVWSRRAVGSDTGHVAIVDAVGGTDSATGELKITISEMNVDGLDDASLGQGAGYTAPAWAGGTGPSAGQAGPWATQSDPSLGVGLWSSHLATVSESPATVTATVTTASATVVKRLSLAANRVVSLSLPTGTYTVCVSQAAAAGWSAAGGCATATWHSARATVARVQPGGRHRARRHRARAHRRPRHGRRPAARFTA